ncbi:MAG: 4Fe-4S binding protein [Methanocellales archaeon]
MKVEINVAKLDERIVYRRDSIFDSRELTFYPDKCMKCGECSRACPHDAMLYSPIGAREAVSLDLNKCVFCKTCSSVCPYNALELTINALPTASTIKGLLQIDTAKCPKDCIKCIEVCPREALKMANGKLVVDEKLCGYCGVCRDACPEKIIKVYKATEGEIAVDLEKCDGCGNCVRSCPYKIITHPEATKPFEIPENIKIESKYCVFCGTCTTVCPNNAITLKKKPALGIPGPWNKALERVQREKVTLIRTINIAEDICVGCGDCSIACPLNKLGKQTYEVVNGVSVNLGLEECNGCGLCAKVCPVSAVAIEGPKISKVRMYRIVKPAKA